MNLSKTPKAGEVPGRFKEFMRRYPAVASAYTALGNASQEAGPLEIRTRALVKLGIAIGMQHQGATHSHVRKALEAGATPEEIRHAAVLGVTTMGFPRTIAALSWVDDVLG
jgi:4-carboxymuconolactone decarboxylase